MSCMVLTDPANRRMVVLRDERPCPQLLVRGFVGPKGPQGVGTPGPKGDSFKLSGSVGSYPELPDTLTADDAGQAWLVNADGRVYVWNGTAWPADGTGALLSQGGGDASFHFHQATAADSWVIQHNLGKRPSVTVTDSAGNRGLCAVKYLDENNLVVSFGGAFAGDAYLN